LAEREELLTARALTRRYPARGGVRGRERRSGLLAVDGVSLTLFSGEIVGLIGRSGAGKSTLARLMLGLETPDAGEVRFRGKDIRALGRAGTRQFRTAVQIVFQDPQAAMDPRQRVESIVVEPMRIQRRRLGRDALRRGALELLADVGIAGGEAVLDKYPHELSGGERQRVTIARALASDPSLLVLDEPVSALDLSVRCQVLNLLLTLQRRRHIGMLLIAHDLELVARICQRLVVMAGGRVVEEGPSERVLARPSQRATRELLTASVGMR
jgi:ABC-type glutathione transport system ATPase component